MTATSEATIQAQPFTNLSQMWEAAEAGATSREIAERLTPETASWVRQWECQARNEAPGAPEHTRAVRAGELWQALLLPAAQSIPRAEEVVAPTRCREELVTCDCGHDVPRSAVMSASNGTSCPDCYDDMSE